MQVKNMEQIIK